MTDKEKIADLIDILIKVDAKDMELCNNRIVNYSIFDKDTRSRIGDAILPELTKRHRELTKTSKISI